uniref:acetyl-CoA C-acyltransferase n=1 Tax=Nephromyces sp. MMRI TaxID=2496275 RepID=A0A3Q8UBQ2_9APIC|nr:acetyl-CoA acyltransferase 1 [Nephromyces sp. MMRI]AZL94410.1 acetyl-CoA acyltransferase 1 [Nephromyces sp. MMRI]
MRNVAEKYGISRHAQDEFASESHAKASNALNSGLYKEEIVPVPVLNGESVKVISLDDGIRPSTTVQALSKLKPSFKEGGSTHAGNSSQVSDGAALVLLTRRSIAEQLKLPILAKFVAFSAVGVPPEIMGIGPSVAIPAVLAEAGLKLEDIDIFEVNEAFASQAVYCADLLGIPKEKLNPKGGAIALGHPLGATGARQIATLLPELRRTGKKLGIVSMCVGTGMGCAAVIENLM